MKPIAAMLLLIFLPASSTQAGNLGRLFFTPEQRIQLESHQAQTADGDVTSTLLVNGIVQQHGGARTVWINGAVNNLHRGGEPASEAVVVPGKSSPIRVKVGEKRLLKFPDASAPQSSPEIAE